MPTRKRAAEEPAEVIEDTVRTVRLSPVPGAYISGEPAAEREVTPEEAERLLAYFPPAYEIAAEPEAEEPLPPQPPTLIDAVAEPQE